MLSGPLPLASSVAVWVALSSFTLATAPKQTSISGVQSHAVRLDHWTPVQARANCTELATLAIRRATVTQLIFTRPFRHFAGVWTLTGVVRLSRAPGGLRRAPFTCTFTATQDSFVVTPVQLTMGP